MGAGSLPHILWEPLWQKPEATEAEGGGGERRGWGGLAWSSWACRSDQAAASLQGPPDGTASSSARPAITEAPRLGGLNKTLISHSPGGAEA